MCVWVCAYMCLVPWLHGGWDRVSMSWHAWYTMNRFWGKILCCKRVAIATPLESTRLQHCIEWKWINKTKPSVHHAWTLQLNPNCLLQSLSFSSRWQFNHIWQCCSNLGTEHIEPAPECFLVHIFAQSHHSHCTVWHASGSCYCPQRSYRLDSAYIPPRHCSIWPPDQEVSLPPHAALVMRFTFKLDHLHLGACFSWRNMQGQVELVGYGGTICTHWSFLCCIYYSKVGCRGLLTW